MANNFKEYAVLGFRQGFELEDCEGLGENFEFTNLKNLKEFLKALAKDLGTSVGNFDTGYYDDEKTDWYIYFTEYVCLPVEDNDCYAYEWFKGISIPTLFGEAKAPTRDRYMNEPKGQLLKV